MEPIYKNLYQFSVYIPTMDFTIHEYLLGSDPSVLFATGTVQQAREIVPEVKRILNGRELKYIFVSHIESDECGGLNVFLKEFPNVCVICSTLAARELSGFGYGGSVYPVSSKDELTDGGLRLNFFDYPSEVHLQNGIVCLEKNSGIFYSADLMLRYGNGVGKTVQQKWSEEVGKISEDRVPSPYALNKLKQELFGVSPSFVAVGHGFCVECDQI